MVGKYTVWEPVEDDEAIEQIATGIHIGLRKNDGSSWEDAVKFCVWGLKEMGFAICRKTSSS
jgi:hypothetical protein